MWTFNFLFYSYNWGMEITLLDLVHPEDQIKYILIPVL